MGGLSQQIRHLDKPLDPPSAAQPVSATASGSGIVATLARTFPALTVPAFRILWLSTIPSMVGWQMASVAVGYAALTLSGSATVLGVVSSLIGLPMLFISPLAGVLADRLPRRSILFFTQGTLGASAAITAVLAYLNLLEAWQLGVLSLVQGTALSFNMPARQSLAMQLVGPGLARSAASLYSAVPNFCRVVGPSIAGLLLTIPGVGIGGTYLFIALMYGMVLLAILGLPRLAAPPSDGRGLRSVWESLAEGFSYILRSPIHRALMGAPMFLLILGLPLIQIMPVFSENVFHVGATGLGILLSANGVGALIGAVGAAALAGYGRLGLMQIVFGVLFGLSIVGFALAPSMLVATAMIGVCGFAQGVFWSLNGTLLMGNTEPRLYGRVLSIYMMTFSVTPIASLPIAWVTDHAGPTLTVGVAGALVTAGMAILAIVSPVTRQAR